MRWPPLVNGNGTPTGGCLVPRTETTTCGLMPTVLRGLEVSVGGWAGAAPTISTSPSTLSTAPATRSSTCEPVACWSNSTSKPGWRIFTWNHRRQRRRGHRGPDPPIFDLQGSINVLDPCNNFHAITRTMHYFRQHN